MVSWSPVGVSHPPSSRRGNGGSESPIFTTGLPLKLRGSYVVSSAATATIPSFADPILSLMERTSCDESRWSRQEGVAAGSVCDGREVETGGPCCSPEPLVAVVLLSTPSEVEPEDRGEGSVLLQELARKAACLVQETCFFCCRVIPLYETREKRAV